MLHPSDNDSVTEEIALLAQIGAGDRAAFRALYGRYSSPLFALALRMVRDRTEAEELLQDAFVKIWRASSTYDARLSKPFTWAVTIMRRLCIDHLRKRGHSLPLALLSQDEVGGNQSVFAPENVHGAVEQRETSERVIGALSELPREQREALDLALFSGMTHAEIAQRLQQPLGTIKTWLRRGLLDLRATLTREKDPSL